MNDLSSIWLLLAILSPVGLAILLVAPACRKMAQSIAPAAALPALGLALLGPENLSLQIPWLLKQTVLVMDQTARIYLGFTSVLYLTASWYSKNYLREDPHATRFFGLLAISMGANFGVILAGDIPAFYLSYALLGLASAGLVFHKGNPESIRAGRLYLILAVIGEVLLFTGLTILAAQAKTTLISEIPAGAHSTWTIIAIAVGFGIKAGALTLHFWLPLAHPAAPVPASAVLSGSMIKVGLLGWIRFLPLGEEPMTLLGVTGVALGLSAAYFGVVAGIRQTNPKTILAYSSISQMGIMTIGIGIGLMRPEAWPVILAATLVYVVHHALAKSALFLGVPLAKEAQSRIAVFWTRVGLLLPALALAGAPFTSGAVAKLALKPNLQTLPAPWGSVSTWLLTLAAAGTTLLMFRFLWITWPHRSDQQDEAPLRIMPSWAFAVLTSMLGIWLVPGALDLFTLKFTPSLLWKAIWPLLFGAALALLWRKLQSSGRFSWKRSSGWGISPWLKKAVEELTRASFARAESWIVQPAVSGALLLLLMILLLVLLGWSDPTRLLE